MIVSDKKIIFNYFILFTFVKNKYLTSVRDVWKDPWVTAGIYW